VRADERLPDLFARAEELEEEERAVWLATLAAREPALAREVEQLLATTERPHALLDPARWPLLDEPLPAPTRIGPYRIVRELGRGGMGWVFLAEHEGDGFSRTVAVKLLDAAKTDPEALRRFREEARILASLEHPGIARFLDAGRTEEGLAYLVLEYVEGTDLLTHAAALDLDVEARLRLFVEVVEAVAHAHRQRVVHRDLKPANVLVGRGGRPMLLDFGIARLAPGGGDEQTATRTGLRVLTPAYASPEQLAGEPVSPASDVYSLGVVLYELLTGRRPPSVADGTGGQGDRDPDPPSAVGRRGGAAPVSKVPAARGGRVSGRIPRDLDAICLEALRRLPEHRYPSATELAADLRRLLAGEPVRARRGHFRYRAALAFRRHRVAIVAATAVVAALFLGVLFGPLLPFGDKGGLAADHATFAALVADQPMDRSAREDLLAGWERLAALDPLAARERLLASAARAPASPLGWDLLARAEAELGEPGRAAAALAHASRFAATLPDDERDRVRSRALAADHRWSEAIPAFEALIARLPDRLDIGLDLVAAQLAAGETEAAMTTIGRLRPVAGAADDPRLDLLEAEGGLLLGEQQRALAAARRALRRGGELGARVLVVRARLLLGTTLRRLDQRPEGDRELQLAAAEARALGLRRDEAWATLTTASIASGVPADAETRRRVGESLDAMRAVGDRRGESAALCELARQLGMEGDEAAARRAVDESLRVARAAGDRWSEGDALSTRVVLANWADDADSVKADTDPALRALRESGHRRALLVLLSNTAIGEIESLELEAAAAHVEEAHELARQLGSQVHRSSVLRARAFLEQTRGDHERARQSFQAALELARAMDRPNTIADYLGDLAWLEVDANRPEEARRRALEAIDAYRRAGMDDLALQAEGILAWVEALNGDVAGARARMRKLRVALVPAGEEEPFNLLTMEAEVAEVVGDFAEARAKRLEALRRAEDWGAAGLVVQQKVQLLQLLAVLEEREAAEALARELIAEGEQRGLRGVVREANAVLAGI
jgi:tRNA A-37 threonylcarbamoyl transferase component Bud32/tetratricopeptide (TPR) repeat protein